MVREVVVVDLMEDGELPSGVIVDVVL